MADSVDGTIKNVSLVEFKDKAAIVLAALLGGYKVRVISKYETDYIYVWKEGILKYKQANALICDDFATAYTYELSIFVDCMNNAKEITILKD